MAHPVDQLTFGPEYKIEKCIIIICLVRQQAALWSFASSYDAAGVTLD